MIALHVFVAVTVKLQKFVISEADFFTIRAGTHYDVSIASRLAKNI